MRLFFLLLVPTLLLTDLFWWRWADRRLRALPHGWIARVALAGFMVTLMGAMVALFVLGRMFALPDILTDKTLIAATYLWHILVAPALLLAMIAGGAMRMVRRIVRQRPTATVDDGPPEDSISPSRRQFLGAALAVTPPLLVGGAVMRSMAQLGSFRVRRFVIPVAGLPTGLDGLTIAQVADIHIGKFTSGRILNDIVEATNMLRADLVLLTGDLIDYSLADLPAGIDLVNRLDPRHGLAMCEGNHDLFQNRRAFDTRVKAAGIPLLIDEAMTVRVRGRTVQLLGMPWGEARTGGESIMDASMQRLAQLRDPEAFPILLAHHPHALDHAAKAGWPLTLSGHTHGGQLMMSENVGFGPMMYRYWSGYYRRDASHLVVSNGVGNWFPLRINAPAEIVHVTLRGAGYRM